MPRGRPSLPYPWMPKRRTNCSASPAPARFRTGSCGGRGSCWACAEGEPNAAFAARMGLSNATVGKWRRRYRQHGIEGLHDGLRPGRPRMHEDERAAEVINTALRIKPPGTPRSGASAPWPSTPASPKSTVQRWFDLFGVQPHRQRHFKLSNDPFFVEKVRDIVGPYLNPPDHAVVLCVDEKTRIQAALQSAQPMLPMGLGYVEG